jgi:hypothetical protein
MFENSFDVVPQQWQASHFMRGIFLVTKNLSKDLRHANKVKVRLIGILYFWLNTRILKR